MEWVPYAPRMSSRHVCYSTPIFRPPTLYLGPLIDTLDFGSRGRAKQSVFR